MSGIKNSRPAKTTIWPHHQTFFFFFLTNITETSPKSPPCGLELDKVFSDISSNVSHPALVLTWSWPVWSSLQHITQNEQEKSQTHAVNMILSKPRIQRRFILICVSVNNYMVSEYVQVCVSSHSTMSLSVVFAMYMVFISKTFPVFFFFFNI